MSLSSGALNSSKRNLNTTSRENVMSGMIARHWIPSAVSALGLDAYIGIDAMSLPVNCVSPGVALLEHGYRIFLFTPWCILRAYSSAMLLEREPLRGKSAASQDYVRMP